MKIKEKKIIYVIVGFVLVIVLGFVLFKPGSKKEVVRVREVSIYSGGNSIKVKSSGEFAFFGADGSVDEQFWGTKKTAAFFDYIKRHADTDASSSSYTVVIDGVTYYVSLDDELLAVIFSEFGVQPEGVDEVGEIFSNYFASPVPVQTSIAQPTPTPTDSILVGGSDMDICPFWKIGFCVYPSPTPSPGSVPVSASTTIPVEICDLVDKQITTRTVVSNTLCLQEPE